MLFSGNSDRIIFTFAAKYPLPPKMADFAKKILEASDWLKAYNRGRAFNLW